MASFAKPARQADKLSRELFRTGQIKSLGTTRTYSEGLTRAAEWLRANHLPDLREMTPQRAQDFLTQRATVVGQKTLDRDRQAIQSLLHSQGKIAPEDRLPIIRAEQQQVLSSRNYTDEQVQRIIEHMAPHNALATELAYVAGLRAHELLTLTPLAERQPDVRPTDPDKFCGRDGVRYTVEGKGGLCREVLIPTPLAERLEACRRDEPIQVTDRQVHYLSRYSLGGGQPWSKSFSSASLRALGFSNGAHGLRHSYAQQRHYEVQRAVGEVERGKRIVSQELGHFRADITDAYLR